ncbi:MAG: amino acid permease, partial [Calditrichaeota bacterium]
MYLNRPRDGTGFMMKPSVAAPEHGSGVSELRRELGLLDSTMINVGTIIGSGIFIVPTTIAQYLNDSFSVIAIWIIGGIISMFGALSVAELGAAMPKAGGQYVYLGRAYGPVWGFLYGWTAFAVINTASIAAVAVAFATYLGFFIPLGAVAIKVIAIVSIILLTAINCLGVKLGAWTQNGFTFLKMAALAAIILFSFALSGGDVANFSPVLPRQSLSSMLG